MRRAAVVSHWDVDGVASAAIAKRLGASIVKLASITALPRMIEEAVQSLEKSGGDTLIIADLNPSPGQELLIVTSLDYALSLGVRIIWLDHHEWEQRIIEELRGMGVDVRVDTGRVAAELVMEALGCRDGVCMRLVELAVDDDRFVNSDRLAVRWRRLLRWYGWRVRYQAVEEWARGRIWPEWARSLWEKMEEEYERLMEKTVAGVQIHKRNGLSIATVRVASEKLHPGEVHERLLEKGVEADIYAMIYENGVSLRSSTAPLACIARLLGGGGHDNAAGIPGGEWTPESLVDALLGALERCASERPTDAIRARASLATWARAS
ncbi:phosphohydrolase (DHH superfamily)-like protein [Pyrolobus fumarii 1A]|uniref:Phosphohydrolase (DHH superfamily)-like protein n=1 Tax=Pyrolobus fumarii (strain DSM 11204 / 1A) TaxID=694429 RepID=G0EGY0_PYRF1|nr:phosphohydrolase [Pyrolobus fumarii]AEM38430.1 phosphohydrolase (DHH superfamily)-like protein [Pyrolobus fumarii 1A]